MDSAASNRFQQQGEGASWHLLQILFSTIPQNVNTFTGRCTAECMASLMSAENTFVQLGERMKMKKFASVAAYEKTE